MGITPLIINKIKSLCFLNFIAVCFQVIDTSFTIERTDAILDKVTCSGDEESLWDCTAKYSKAKLQPCNNVTSVICGGEKKTNF
jgi:hypothetical protein